MAVRHSALVLALGLLVPSGAVVAQEQRGSIEGVVRDSSGAVLAGATIEARSPALTGAGEVRTDELGKYRFPALPPGVYEITATSPGFIAAKASGIKLELGQILSFDIRLKVRGIAETVDVTAGSPPAIDVRQNAAAANIQAELIARIPKGSDYTSVITVAPSVDLEQPRSFGISIDGASGADNRYFVDGVDLTDLQTGRSLSMTGPLVKTVSSDFLEQVEVKTSGYNPEYRASIGGVVNAITRSGGDQWSGAFAGYFGSDKLLGHVRPILQLKPTDPTVAEYVTSPPDAFKSQEVTAEFGGPIVRDRLWFHVGYNPQWTKTSRTVVFVSNPALGRRTYEALPIDQIATYNVAARLSTALRAKFAATHERVRGGRDLPGIRTDGTSYSNPSLYPSTTWTNAFKDSYSGVLDWTASPRTYISAAANFLTYGGQTEGAYSTALMHLFAASNIPTSPASVFNDIPSSLQNVAGYRDNPSSSRLVRDTYHRFGLNGDVTRYATWHGSHIVKAGVQFERVSNSELYGDQAPSEWFFWGASYATDTRLVTGRYGYYEVTRSWAEGDVGANNTSTFVQDTWTLSPRLTLNLGVRAENDHVPSYRPENPGLRLGFRSELAPRLGFAYDVKGNGRWKAYGSWGIFYDHLKLTLGQVMFGAQHHINYYYTLDTYDWRSINCDYPPTSNANCPGTFIGQYNYIGSPANEFENTRVDPNLRPTTTEEFTLGMDHELNPTTSVGVRFVRKWADYVIEAVCTTDWVCGVNNPGFGTGKHPFIDGPDQPPARRVYDALEFRVRKRYAKNWSLDASYVYSRLWGNWSGVGSSDEAVFCLQPNSCLAFNLLYYSYDASGHPSYGALGTDRPHKLKATVTCELPWGTQVGVNQLAESGIPQSTIIKERTDGINFFPYGRGNLGRTPFYTQTNLLLQQPLPVPGRRMRVLLGANVMNLFDQQTVTLGWTMPYRDAFAVPNAQFFAGFAPVAYAANTKNIRADPRFRMPRNLQGQRAITIQARLIF